MSSIDDSDMREACLAAVSESPQMHPLEAAFFKLLTYGYKVELRYDELDVPFQLSVTRMMVRPYTCVIRLKGEGSELEFEDQPSGVHT